MIKGGKQQQTLSKFYQEKGFEQHPTGQLFRRNSGEQWILYRIGTKHPQRMKPTKELFPGWTFSKSLGNTEENRLYKCVCLHEVAYNGIEEAVLYAPKSVFKKYVNRIKAKRLYVAQNPDRIFDPARKELIHTLSKIPIFDR